MKFSAQCLIMAVAAIGFDGQAVAFAPVHRSTRAASNLDITTLEEWQVLDNGSVVGSVRGHPSLGDGDIITTSPLADPSSIKPLATIKTLTGSEYKLGNPIKLKPNGSTGSTVVSSPGVDRGTLLKGAGLTSLFVGGIAAGFTLSGGMKDSMTIPEVNMGID